MQKMIKQGCIVFFGVFFVLISPIQYSAAESKQYESNAGVGFYGNYEYPKDTDEEAQEPIHGAPSDGTSIGLGAKPTPPMSKPTGSFPSTGEVVDKIVPRIGILLLVGIFIVVAKRVSGKKRG